MAVQIQIRRDTAANWTSNNPTLAQGEMGYESDTHKLKFGDGTTAWSGLSYFGGSGGGYNGPTEAAVGLPSPPVAGTSYTNSQTVPQFLFIRFLSTVTNSTDGALLRAYVNGNMIGQSGFYENTAGAANAYFCLSIVVPSGLTYEFDTLLAGSGSVSIEALNGFQ